MAETMGDRIRQAITDAPRIADDIQAGFQALIDAGKITLWIAVTADYDSDVVGVYSSPEAAEASLRKTYAAPYVVQWEPIAADGEAFVIVGHFEQVDQHSTRHTMVILLRQFILDE